MPIKYQIAILLSVGVIAYSVGRWLTPPKIETKVEVVEKEVVKRDVKIVEREVKRPDGTTIIDRETIDKSIETVEKEIKKETVVSNLPKLHISAGIITTLERLQKPDYIVTVEKNVLTTISVGITATTNNQVGVVLGYSF